MLHSVKAKAALQFLKKSFSCFRSVLVFASLSKTLSRVLSIDFYRCVLVDYFSQHKLLFCRIVESGQEAFILRLYRQKNKVFCKVYGKCLDILVFSSSSSFTIRVQNWKFMESAFKLRKYFTLCCVFIKAYFYSTKLCSIYVNRVRLGFMRFFSAQCPFL